MRFSLSIQLLLAWSHIKLSMTQCHLTPRVTTKPSDTSVYKTDEIDLTTILFLPPPTLHLGYLGNKPASILGKYRPQDHSLPSPTLIAPRLPRQQAGIHHCGKSCNTNSMLTNVIRISEKRIFIPSENTSVLLTKQQFKEVCKELGIMLKLRDDGPLQTTVYKDHK